ncbi:MULTISPECIES: helix-turn-helix domain-containing protein [Arthrobacter]|uniref:Helix-turn-helix domain-containing protein n=2 Tax=Arthrobacter TaxID=1663 RepID=A0ABU9KIQ7_9MICC|nr:helix-turn-helix domain-containing protein [Arthrobacter sp. YJM1]MDP5226262.1 helix-turn-helix domain-containing protein [Arthrobacter sp. YJM1]
MAADTRPRTLRELTSVLDTAGLSLHHLGGNPELALSSPVILDPLEPLPALPGGILLGVGLPAGATEVTAQALAGAARQGYAAVVLKSGPAAPDPQGRQALEALAGEGPAVLLVEGELSWRHLDTLLESALGAVAEASNAPTALGVGDLFALANAIAAMVGGATTIENLQEEVLAYSTLPEQPIDDDRQRGILGRQVPYLPENAEQYAAVFRSRGAVRIQGVGEGAMDRLAIAVRAGTQPIGSIWVVDADGDLPEDSVAALERSADIAALHLLQARSSNDLARQQRADGLRRLLEGDGDGALVARHLNLAPEGPFAVLAFAPDVVPGSEAVTLSRLMDLVSIQCESQRRGTWCVLLEGTIYALLSGLEPGQERSVESLARRVIDRAAVSLRLPLRAALGAVVGAVGELAGSRRSADRVLLLQSTTAGGHDYTTAAQEHSRLTLVELGAVLGSREGLLSPAALAMARHDERHGTDYIRTVRTYLDAGRDSARTAAELSLHQNSLRYRLRRIEEIFGVDLSGAGLTGADDTLVLWLSLRVMEGKSS